MKANERPEISCVSLGMLILDEIRMPNKAPLLNVIGGSSAFVTLGLRLFAERSGSVGCLVLAGSDFPEEVKDEVRSWHTTLVVMNSLDRKSSRGLLAYQDDTFGPKTFEYTTPPIRAIPRNLVSTKLLTARAFHFFGSPEEIIEQVPELLRFREKYHPSLPKPFLVWEPLPSSCTPSSLPVFHTACNHVDVFSPNHLELAGLLSDAQIPQPEETNTLSHLSNLGMTFLNHSTNTNTTLVLRAASHGALALHRSTITHVPAFYAPNDPHIVDPTGAGNAFLGGYMAGWLHSNDVKTALCYGAVAASFALEQVGLPGRGEVGFETGMQRLEGFRDRV